MVVVVGVDVVVVTGLFVDFFVLASSILKPNFYLNVADISSMLVTSSLPYKYRKSLYNV